MPDCEERSDLEQYYWALYERQHGKRLMQIHRHEHRWLRERRP